MGGKVKPGKYSFTCPKCIKTYSMTGKPRGKHCMACKVRGRNKKPPGDWALDQHGYFHRWVNDKWTKQHRLIMEEYLGRPLLSSEHVHHINGIKNDNRIENLEVLPAGDHHRENSGILDRLVNGNLI